MSTRSRERTSVPHPFAGFHPNLEEVDAEFRVYDGATFKSDRFAAYLAQSGRSWSRYPSGQLILDNATFREQSRRYPQLYPLRQLRATVSGLRLAGLTIGRDGRNRCLLSPVASLTGRNQPSNSKYIFEPAKWMRHLIKPPEGYGVAYIDWVSQELAIAGALSGDERMIAGYLTGDSYMAFARQRPRTIGCDKGDASPIARARQGRLPWRVVWHGSADTRSAPRDCARRGGRVVAKASTHLSGLFGDGPKPPSRSHSRAVGCRRFSAGRCG